MMQPLAPTPNSSLQMPPHPFAAVPSGSFVKESEGAITNRLNQSKRRAEILAGARWLLAREGIERISVRSVADVGQVAVQTIYNLVGDRTVVFSDAIVEYIVAMGKRARALEGYPNCVLALCDTYWQSYERYPDYMRNATLTYWPPTRLLYVPILNCGRRLVELALRKMDKEGSLREDVELTQLATHINSLIAITMLDGVSGQCTVADLRWRLLTGCAFMLKNALNSAAAARMEQWVREQGRPA